jgi:hypothetical protein
LLFFLLELCDLDRDLDRIDDLARRGRDSRRADDRRNRGEDTPDLLGVDADLAGSAEVQQIRDGRGIDRSKRSDANEHECLRIETTDEALLIGERAGFRFLRLPRALR